MGSWAAGANVELGGWHSGAGAGDGGPKVLPRLVAPKVGANVELLGLEMVAIQVLAGSFSAHQFGQLLLPYVGQLAIASRPCQLPLAPP